MERISAEVEVPSLVIALGVLMLVARTMRLPEPRWTRQPER
jgi:hypothetical protein